jgi:hypothetical protein
MVHAGSTWATLTKRHAQISRLQQDTKHGYWNNPAINQRLRRVQAKDLLGIPWMLAFALRDDGWHLHRDHLGQARASAECGRPADGATEKMFLLSKARDISTISDAVREPNEDTAEPSNHHAQRWREIRLRSAGRGFRGPLTRRGSRSAFVIGWAQHTQLVAARPRPSEALRHLPERIPRRAILAGTSARGVCPKCGGAVGAGNQKIERGTHHVRDSLVDGSYKLGGQREWDAYQPAATIGWRLTCLCQLLDPRQHEWCEQLCSIHSLAPGQPRSSPTSSAATASGSS